MPYISRTSRVRIALFFLALGLIALLNYLTPWLIPLRYEPSGCYILLLAAWGLTVRRRILHRRTRGYFLLGTLFLMLLFFLRYMRYSGPSDVTPLSRFLWYAYYPPLLAVPLCSLSAALSAGLEDSAPKPRFLLWLWAVMGLLSALILANDLHGWLFRFRPAAEGAGSYDYGWLYYATYVWGTALTVAALAVLVRRCRLSQCRRIWYIPVLSALPGFALLLWYAALGGNSPMLLGHKLYHFHEAYSMMFVFVWESCIQIGLIFSNTDYDAIFEQTPLQAFILGRDGRVLSRAGGAAIASAQQRDEAKRHPVSLDEDHILHSHPIREGTAYWIEDISAINAVNRKIADAIDYLEDEQALLGEEARIRSERASYEFRNRLYDSISPLVQPQLSAVQQLLSDRDCSEADFAERLTRSMVLAAYVKRRVNLVLLADRAERMRTGELELAIHESLEYLRLRGTVCALDVRGGGIAVPTARLMLAYDFFEAVLEAALPSLSALHVLLGTEAAFSLKLILSSPAATLPGAWRSKLCRRLGAQLELTEEEDAHYALLRFGEEEGK